MRRIVRGLARRLGYEIRRISAAPTSDTALHFEIPPGVLRQLRDHTMLSATRLQALADAAHHVARQAIDGDFVQCGVWRGGSAGLMAHVLLASGVPPRTLRLFDSFEGIPEPDAAVDGERAVREAEAFGCGTAGRLVANPQFYTRMGRAVGSLGDARRLLTEQMGYPPGSLVFHEGMFEETVPRDAPSIGSIALLHLDGDWYSSTRVCLRNLYDKVVSGGLVMIDDYGAYEGCQRAVDAFFAERRIRSYLHQIDEEAVVFEKR